MVTMVLAGGTGLAVLILPTAGALVHTAYGGVLLVKLAVVGGVLMLSVANHHRLVPAISRGDRAAVRVLTMNVAVEQIGLLAVILITDILMRQNPGA
jgi:putative copper export protein